MYHSTFTSRASTHTLLVRGGISLTEHKSTSSAPILHKTTNRYIHLPTPQNPIQINQSQQPQPPRNPIHHPPRPGPHPQHRHAPTRHLRPARVPDDLGAQAHADGLGPQQQQLFLVGDLQGDFGLAGGFPAFEQGGGGGGGGEEGFVAGEGGVGALGCYFAWMEREGGGGC